ncbi:MAG: 5-formyltetrahydrofolate cyclo-ligase [Thiotrichales bacterium 12-47-6]|nr:MAG: 5-formyltetrahydrofolate cyclo-ligase [Thiotrichales bacterium 12-47-6]
MADATISINAMNDKKALRTSCRRARQSLTQSQQQQHAQAVMQTLLSLPFLQSASLSIGASLAFDGEVDLMATMRALKSQHRLYLPRLKPDTTLDFLLWQETADMKANVLGIPEPIGEQVISIAELDLVFMPLVGVDLQGNRLGMGAGYYDKSLAQSAQRPYLIGVAHQCQQVESLPVDPWDIPLDALVTERGMTVWRPYAR